MLAFCNRAQISGHFMASVYPASNVMNMSWERLIHEVTVFSAFWRGLSICSWKFTKKKVLHALVWTFNRCEHDKRRAQIQKIYFVKHNKK